MSGLSKVVEDKIKSVFERYINIETAVLYGSRAMGSNRENSDIDITIKGNIEFSELLKIESQLDELLLPYKIDLSVYNSLSNKELIDHINRAGKIFYKKTYLK